VVGVAVGTEVAVGLEVAVGTEVAVGAEVAVGSGAFVSFLAWWTQPIAPTRIRAAAATALVLMCTPCGSASLPNVCGLCAYHASKVLVTVNTVPIRTCRTRAAPLVAASPNVVETADSAYVRHARQGRDRDLCK
jgi:hypothetical protein